jgi:hypothetical protein
VSGRHKEGGVLIVEHAIFFEELRSILLLRQPNGDNGKVTGDVHAKNGSSRAKISHIELMADMFLDGGDLVEGIGDNEYAVDVDRNNACAIDGVVHGIHIGVGGGALEANAGRSGVEE